MKILNNILKLISNVYPKSGTNIGSHIKIRKGDFDLAWANCEETITASYSFNLSDHAALETRSTRVEINPSRKGYCPFMHPIPIYD